VSFGRKRAAGPDFQARSAGAGSTRKAAWVDEELYRQGADAARRSKEERENIYSVLNNRQIKKRPPGRFLIKRYFCLELFTERHFSDAKFKLRPSP
jgi:hypothetical protein